MVRVFSTIAPPAPACAAPAHAKAEPVHCKNVLPVVGATTKVVAPAPDCTGMRFTAPPAMFVAEVAVPDSAPDTVPTTNVFVLGLYVNVAVESCSSP